MYAYKDIKSIHFEITSKCQAKCPMCPRRISAGPPNPFVKINEVSLEQFKEWFPDDFVKQLTHLSMCGNLGDPIVAKDTLSIFHHLRELNPDMLLVMNTNGSARTDQWWQKLASLQVKAVFGIDGLKDTHHLYRINTDWDKIIYNAKVFIEAGGIARWDMIAFAHNEHQIDDCRQLSEQLGFEGFEVKHTSRFRDDKFYVLDDQGKPINILRPTEKSLSMVEKIKVAQEEKKPYIDCKAKKYNQIYVSASGNVSPCCWLDQEWYLPTADSRIDYMDKIDYFPNLNHTSLEQLFQTDYFLKIAGCWDSTGLKECTKQCGSFDRYQKQYDTV